MLLTANEAAKKLNVSKQTIFNMVDRGEIIASRISEKRLLRIDEKELEKYVDSKKSNKD